MLSFKELLYKIQHFGRSWHVFRHSGTRGRVLKAVCWWASILVPALCIIYVLRFVLLIGSIREDSMSPLVRDQALYIANRLSYVQSPPERGDVVICRFGNDVVIKRVIGLPGDEISFDSGYVVLNGSYLMEDYLPEGVYTCCEESFVIPPGMYFIMGDNRSESFDSRFSIDPFIYRSDIMARVLCGLNDIRHPFICYRTAYETGG